MASTVFVNSRAAAHKGAGGKAVCMTPDVCKTPAAPSPVPVPYPNIAKDSDNAKGSKTVRFDGKPIFLKTSEFSTSSGDEAGSVGGVVSSKFKGKAKFILYSFDVKVEGENVCRHLDMTLMNGNAFNDNGTYTLNSGVTVVLARMPTKKECQRALKLLGDFAGRIKKTYSAKAATQMIAKLTALGGSITGAHLPSGSVFDSFLERLTRDQLAEICG